MSNYQIILNVSANLENLTQDKITKAIAAGLVKILEVKEINNLNNKTWEDCWREASQHYLCKQVPDNFFRLPIEKQNNILETSVAECYEFTPGENLRNEIHKLYLGVRIGYEDQGYNIPEPTWDYYNSPLV